MCKMINLVLHSGVMVEFVAEDDIKMQKCFISQVNRNTWLSCFTETQKYPEHKLSRGVSLLWLPLLLVYIHEGCLCWDLIGCCCRGAVPPLVGVQVRRTRRFRSELSQKLQWGRFFLVLSSWWETGSQSDEPKTTKEDRTRNKEEVKRGWRSEHETSGLCLCLPAGFIHRFVL